MKVIFIKSLIVPHTYLGPFCSSVPRFTFRSVIVYFKTKSKNTPDSQRKKATADITVRSKYFVNWHRPKFIPADHKVVQLQKSHALSCAFAPIGLIRNTTTRSVVMITRLCLEKNLNIF